MNVRQLRYFLAVAEHGHFTRAAEASFVSQPALSQQIRVLETDLGAPLFDRLPGGAELTTAGRVLRGYAERVVRELEDARSAVEEVAGTVRGELSIATVHTANLGVVVDGLVRFRAAHPGVLVRVHEQRSDEVVSSVLAGRVNVGITYLPVADGPLSCAALYDEELALIVPAAHPLAGESAVALSDLADLPLIVPPGGFCLRDGIDRVLARVAGGARIVAEMSAMESIGEAVRAGLGVTILPVACMRRASWMADLASVPIAPAPRRTIGTIRHGGRHLCLATRAFLATLGEVVTGSDSVRGPSLPTR